MAGVKVVFMVALMGIKIVYSSVVLGLAKVELSVALKASKLAKLTVIVLVVMMAEWKECYLAKMMVDLMDH